MIICATMIGRQLVPLACGKAMDRYFSTLLPKAVCHSHSYRHHHRGRCCLSTSRCNSNKSQHRRFVLEVATGLSGCLMAFTMVVRTTHLDQGSTASQNTVPTTVPSPSSSNRAETLDSVRSPPQSSLPPPPAAAAAPPPAATTALPHTLFVWDFDWTVVNCNSDEYIPAQFITDSKILNQTFRDLYYSKNNSNNKSSTGGGGGGGDLHACVEGVVQKAMQENGATPVTLLEAAQRMPYLIDVRQALNIIDAYRVDKNESLATTATAAAATTNQMILSDGNSLFIGAFLEHHGLTDYFGYGVVTNYGQWKQLNADGAVVLSVTHHSQQYGGHSCDRCSTNLCKSQALQKTLEQQVCENKGCKNSLHKRPRIVYVGDGANDACPVLKVLGVGDVMLARIGRKRTFANQRQGPETDSEATTSSDMDDTDQDSKQGSPFGIIPALHKTKNETGVVPTCRILEWSTGEELKKHVEMLLAEMQ